MVGFSLVRKRKTLVSTKILNGCLYLRVWQPVSYGSVVHLMKVHM